MNGTAESPQPRVVVISGATGGIGRAVAQALAESDLVLLGRNGPGLERLTIELPHSRVHPVDFSDVASVQSAFSSLSRIDCLVHCTGAVAEEARLEHAEPELLRRLLEANLLAPMIVTRAAIPLLRAASGRVVFVSSGAAKRVRPGWSAYAATKFALSALAEGLAVEEQQIKVMTVVPGAVDTPMRLSLGEVSGEDYQASDYLSPAEVASCITFALGMRPEVNVREIDIRVHGS